MSETTTPQRLTLVIAVTLAIAAVVWLRRGERAEAPAPEVTAAAPTPAPPPPADAPPRPAATPPPPALPEIANMSEKLLMARLRDVAKSDSARAIALAQIGNRHYPDSADAPERESILIHALANAERRNEARGRAEFMVNHYPDSSWVREVEAFTGAHRHRNLTTNDAGQLIYTQ